MIFPPTLKSLKALLPILPPGPSPASSLDSRSPHSARPLLNPFSTSRHTWNGIWILTYLPDPPLAFQCLLYWLKLKFPSRALEHHFLPDPTLPPSFTPHIPASSSWWFIVIFWDTVQVVIFSKTPSLSPSWNKELPYELLGAASWAPCYHGTITLGLWMWILQV